MNLNGRKFLVTGAGGFIGSHLTETLVSRGASVRALVHYNALGKCGWLEHSKHRADIEIVAGDITDRDAVHEAAKGVEIIFHLAALIAIPYSYRSPLSYIKTNVEGTFNVLQAAREYNVSKVIHTSTSEVYGTAKRIPIEEDHPLQGQSPYSASKIGADKMVEAFHLSFGVRTVTIRPFNTFGPRQSARAVIPTIITQCLANQAVRLGSLTPTRDMNYVDNTVNGFIAAALVDAAIGRTINLGSGREISVGALAALIGRLMGCELKVEQDTQRLRPEKSEVERLLSDNTLARELLGWVPGVCLEDGLRRTIDWMRSNLDQYRPGVYTV